MKLPNRFFDWIMCFVVIFIGVYLIFSSLNSSYLTFSSENWAETNGKVISSYAKLEAKKGYRPNIIYRYKVNGKTYENDVLGYGIYYIPFINNQRKAQEKAQQYPQDSTVRVYYNPDNPELSCLEKGGSSLGYLLSLIGGVFFIIFGAYGFFDLLKVKG